MGRGAWGVEHGVGHGGAWSMGYLHYFEEVRNGKKKENKYCYC